jgi:hypothetical protein
VSTKNNQNLITCINCGAVISKYAPACPKCQTDEPAGVTCLICHKLSPNNRGVTKTLWTNHRDSSHWQYYHISCSKKLLAPSYSVGCPDCRRIYGMLDIEEINKLKSRTGGCPECGSPQLLLNGKSDKFVGWCRNCEQKINEPYHNYVKINDSYYHELCSKICNISVETLNSSSGCFSVLALLLLGSLLLFELFLKGTV